MKKISIMLLLGAITFVALSMVYQAGSAQAQTISGESQLLQATTSPTPSVADTATATNETQTASMIEEWDKICVRKIPYTILALPEKATFDVVPPEGPVPTPEHGSSNPNVYTCNSVGVFGGKQVVVCSGPSLYSFTLKVSDGGNSEDFRVDLKACPIKPIHPVEPTAAP